MGLVVTLFVVSLAPQMRQPIFSSPSGKAVGWLMATVGPVLPEEARTVLGPFIDPKANPALASDTDPKSPAASSLVEALEKTQMGTSSGSAAADVTPPKSSGSLGDLFKEEEARLSKTISDGAASGVKQAVGGLTGGPVERR